MPNQLTDTLISNTYLGVLHADGLPIPLQGQTQVYDGMGNKSALTIGRDTNGATVTGELEADSVIAGQLTMPNVDTVQRNIVTRTDAGKLELKPISYAMPGLTDGVYTNPKITVTNGIITSIVNQPTFDVLTTPVNLVNMRYRDIRTYLQTVESLATYQQIVQQYSTFPVVSIPVEPSSTVNWSTLSQYSANAKYVLVRTQLHARSGGGKFYAFITIDDKEVVAGEVLIEWPYGNNYNEEAAVADKYGPLKIYEVPINTTTNTVQQLIPIPANKVSTIAIKVRSLPGNTTDLGEFTSRIDMIHAKIDVEGWVY